MLRLAVELRNLIPFNRHPVINLPDMAGLVVLSLWMEESR